MTPRRERLAEALACVTVRDNEVDPDDVYKIEAIGVHRRVLRDDGRWTRFAPWTIDDHAEAWEVLCTRLDLAGAVGEARRMFEAPGYVACQRCGGDGLGSSYDNDWSDAPDCMACYGKGTQWSIRRALPHPATVVDAVAFAADWPRVLTAEAIAREATGASVVVWRVVHHQTMPEVRVNKRGQIVGSHGCERVSVVAQRALLDASGYAYHPDEAFRVADRVTLVAPEMK